MLARDLESRSYITGARGATHHRQHRIPRLHLKRLRKSQQSGCIAQHPSANTTGAPYRNQIRGDRVIHSLDQNAAEPFCSTPRQERPVVGSETTESKQWYAGVRLDQFIRQIRPMSGDVHEDCVDQCSAIERMQVLQGPASQDSDTVPRQSASQVGSYSAVSVEQGNDGGVVLHGSSSRSPQRRATASPAFRRIPRAFS